MPEPSVKPLDTDSLKQVYVMLERLKSNLYWSDHVDWDDGRDTIDHMKRIVDTMLMDQHQTA